MQSDLQEIIEEFIRDARSVHNYVDAKPCVDRALEKMKVAGIDEKAAITMLGTGLASSGMSGGVFDPPNLIHVHTELEKRKTP
jgi:hypothetical protein